MTMILLLSAQRDFECWQQSSMRHCHVKPVYKHDIQTYKPNLENIYSGVYVCFHTPDYNL